MILATGLDANAVFSIAAALAYAVSAAGASRLGERGARYGLVAAWLMLRAEHAMRAGADANAGLPLLTLERLTFRFAGAGFVLLSATLLAGLLFSEALYGRPVKFDHKTVFSILAWLVFAWLLLG